MLADRDRHCTLQHRRPSFWSYFQSIFNGRRTSFSGTHNSVQRSIQTNPPPLIQNRQSPKARANPGNAATLTGKKLPFLFKCLEVSSALDDRSGPVWSGLQAEHTAAAVTKQTTLGGQQKAKSKKTDQRQPTSRS